MSSISLICFINPISCKEAPTILSIILLILDQDKRSLELLRPRRQVRLHVLKAIYKKGGAFKYPSVLQCDNGSEFTSNKTKSNMKLNDTIKLDILVLGNSEINPEENILPEDGLYKHLFQPGEQHRDQKRPATDFTWSKNTYRLD